MYDRLTDYRGYTGLHRHRFDTDGRGLGMRGRDEANTSADMRWIDSTFPKDRTVVGDGGKRVTVSANQTPWTLELPLSSGFGRKAGSGRMGANDI